MSTSDAVAIGPIVDAKFAKRFVIACVTTPLLVLAWDAWRGHLGVNAVNYAIRTTGLVGLIFLTLSLVVTPLKRLTGATWLIATRRNFGVAGFGYIAAHFLLFFIFDRDLSVPSTLEEIVERVYLWFGTAALVIMIPLAVTSTDAMITRLGPKRWKLLHRSAYAAVFAGMIHYYLLVKADTTKPTAFMLVFAGLMAYRVVTHYQDLREELATTKTKLAAQKKALPKPKKFWKGTLKVARIFTETHDVKTFRFVMPDGSPLPFTHTAGQYLNITLPVANPRPGGSKTLTRSYTIASSPARTAYCEISVKRAPDGFGSHILHDQIKEGDLVEIGAPAGKFFFAGHEAERIVLIAGGVGITPMMSVARALTDRAWPGQIFLVFSVRKDGDVIFANELAYLQERFPNLHVKISYSSVDGHITEALLRDFVPDFTRGPVMLCGPEPMMVAMRKLLVGMGIPDAEVHEEAFVSPKAAESAASDAMGEAATVAAAEAPVDGAAITFQRSGQAVELEPGLSILEGAEEAGVAIPFECRSGVCGQCKCRLVSGRVVMAAQDALSSGDRKRGLILACQARPTTPTVVVDA